MFRGIETGDLFVSSFDGRGIWPGFAVNLFGWG